LLLANEQQEKRMKSKTGAILAEVALPSRAQQAPRPAGLAPATPR